MSKLSTILLFVWLLSSYEANAIQNGYDGAADLPIQFPYIASLQLTYVPNGQTQNKTLSANGFLLKPKYVVITPKSVNDVKSGTFVSGTVQVGAYDPKSPNNENKFEVKLEDIIVHPDWDENTYENQIAVIRLPQEVTNVRLPTLVKEGDEIARNECFMAGYGPLTPDGSFPVPLQIVRQPLLCKPGERIPCFERAVQANPPNQSLPCHVQDEKICAGYFQSGSYLGPCSAANNGHGDFGAPLQCNLEGETGQLEAQVIVGFLRRDYCPENNLNAPSERIPSLYSNFVQQKFQKFIEENTNS